MSHAPLPAMNDRSPTHAVPSVSIATARSGASSKINALGMRPMQERTDLAQ